jgi:PAS domain S-box-containing protein
MSSYATDTYGPEDVALAGNIASQISGAVANAQLFAEHTRMADSLRESEASLKSLFRVAPIGIGVVDALLESEASPDGVLRMAPNRSGAGFERVLVRVNDRMCEMLGYAAEELTGKSARMLYPTDEDFDYVGREKYIQIREKGTGSLETRWRRKDGTVIDILLTSTPIDPNDLSRGVTFTALDITEQKRAEEERRKLEERLRQAQKMEAIGTLAGGIAHDFNNILAAIVGFGELARMDTSGNAELTASIDGILKASFRARDLVRQILTFSRQNEAELFPIQPHLVVKEAVKLLRASLPSTIHLRQAMNSQAYILGDPTQIQQVVMNLCTNAYHAMREEGGELEVGLADVCVGNARPAELKAVTPGQYLKLSVRDTGRGIDPAFIHRIFDPYFTTKEKTKGTGLGLAVVHGIVKSHKGAIQVSSRLGAGTTFDVYFPIADAAAGKTVLVQEAAAAGGCERILFVDDEPDIEELGRRLLGSLGYGVATCPDGGAALDLFGADPARFDLVITDMTMPGMTGDRLAVEMMRIRPGLPVILCTGFNELINMDRVKEIGIRALMMKPFLKNEVAKVIREVLERR